MSMKMGLRQRLRSCVPKNMLNATRMLRGIPIPPQDAPPVLVGEGRPYLLKVKMLSDLFPGIGDIKVSTPAAQVIRQPTMLLPLAEALAACAICRWLDARSILEIGTYTGSATYLLAYNSASDAKIITMDYSGSGLPAYKVGGTFLNTPQEAKITQIDADSTNFDFSTYEGTIDVCFIDGDHSYEPVLKDSASAFRLMRPGGVIIWDDYIADPQHSQVSDALNTLRNERDIYHLHGTRLAVYRDERKANA